MFRKHPILVYLFLTLQEALLCKNLVKNPYFMLDFVQKDKMKEINCVINVGYFSI